MVFFDNCLVVIDGSGVLADSASLTMQNSAQALYALGYKVPTEVTIGDAVRGTLSVSYFVEADNEPVFALVNVLKTGHNNFNWTPTQFAVAGVTGSGYLESYSIKTTPNQPTKASASFAIYHPLTGAPSDSKISRDVYFTGICHAWQTSLIFPVLGQSFDVYDFDYSFRAVWEPIYAIGNKAPLQVQFSNAEENITILGEQFYHVNISGSALSGAISYATGLSMNIHDSTRNLVFPFYGMTVKTSQVALGLDDFLKVSINASKAY